jgi:AcrR family transcriptional regulator
MTTATAIPRGRPPAASREAVLHAALHRYLRGRRVDVQAIAAELGLGRTTVYRWFGSRDDLLGAVLAAAVDPVIDDSRARARGTGGRRLLDTFDRLNRSLADSPALRTFVERERDAALRVITSGAGVLQQHMVARMTGLIEAESEAGQYAPPVEPSTLGYAIVKLAEAFLFSDAVAGMRSDVERLREVEAALLGVAQSTRTTGSPTATRPSDTGEP